MLEIVSHVSRQNLANVAIIKLIREYSQANSKNMSEFRNLNPNCPQNDDLGPFKVVAVHVARTSCLIVLAALYSSSSSFFFGRESNSLVLTVERTMQKLL